MFNFYDLKDAQIEISNKCQARCPMCSRNVRSGMVNENLVESEWTLDAYKTIFNHEVLSTMSSINFCGTYGDPLMNDSLIDMIEYTVQINPNLFLSINTNGSLRNKEWWTKLAKVLSKNHNVTFGIDGLEDTHHLYRIGTFFDKIIENAKTFINAGGIATWQFIKFKHNEYQVEEAKRRAKELGFKNFLSVDTVRYPIVNSFDVYDKNNNVTHVLEKATTSNIKEFSISLIKNYKEVLNNVNIDCEAKRRKAVYIDVFYHLYPCCYTAGTVHNSSRYWDPLPGNNEEVKIHWRKGYNEAVDQIKSITEKMGGLDKINVLKRGLKEIFNEGNYQAVWKNQWIGDNKSLICAGTCGGNSEWSISADQYK
jgi:MoaA/NifB/PqqE/SkfB family radical SAM enzyme